MSPGGGGGAGRRGTSSGLVGRRRTRRGNGQTPDGQTPDDRPPEPPADPDAVARQICLHQLEHAPRTRAELAAALARKGVDEQVATRVLERFGEVGLIDDRAYAQAWVSTRHAGRGLASRALAHELRRRGVEEPLVAEAVETLDPEQELATARALVARKLPASRGLAPDVRVRRLASMLARKGYPAGIAFRLVREALAVEGLDPELVSEDAEV